MVIELDSIETERRRKLQTLFFDHVAEEGQRLWSAVDRLALPPPQREELRRTLEFAGAQPYGERDLDRYYVTHPIRVARFAAQWLLDRQTRAYDMLSLALIHNAVEKEVLSPQQVSERWGPWVRDAVVLLTLDREAMRAEEGRRAFYARLAAAPVEVQAVKLFDKLDNLFIICINPDEAVRRDYIGEIERYLLPVAAALLPSQRAYLEELIANSYRLGYYRPDPASLMPAPAAAPPPAGRANA
jgi:(p)ppGpp synthase/HD superfamily hydrolase